MGWLTVSGKNLVDAQDNLSDALDYIDFKVVKFDPASSLGKTERRHRRTFAALQTDTILRVAKFENIKRLSPQNIKKLHIGIACNIYDEENGNSVEQDLMSVGKNIQKTLEKRGYKNIIF